MTEQPDLSTLPARMRYAATVLIEVAERYNKQWVNAGSYADVWSARELARVASDWESDDSAAAEREQLVEELARDIHRIDNPTLDWDDRYESLRQTYREYARKFLACGWTRAADK